jgi:HD-like signal output (HDOD) protein
MKRRILFVDDELNLLEGLKRMLRPMRHEWDMEFVSSGAEALACLEHASRDIVVSDVRMPAMNGVELLNEIKQRHPQTVRFLLSGQADRDIIMKAIGPTHQYLAKPCDAELLKSSIDRACALGDLLQDPSIKQLVSQIDNMPSLPSLYLELEEELQSPDSSIERAAAIVAKDIGMTAKILKIVNSAFLGVPRSISNPVQAVMFLGLETLKTLVLTFAVFQQLTQKTHRGFDADRFWQHSLAAGEQARKIAITEQAEPSLVEASLAGGLLHDVGMLLLLTSFPERYAETLTIQSTRQCPLPEAEETTFGASHAEIGAYLLGLWGIPTPVIEAVAFHHRPAASLAQTLTPLIAVHAANGLLAEKDPWNFESESAPFLNLDYLTTLDLADHIPVWRELSAVAP